MPRRITDDAGATWEVTLSGRRTQYARDELSLEFRRVEGGPAEHRYARFNPRASKIPERAYELASEALLARLLASSQPAWTSPDGGYRRA